MDETVYKKLARIWIEDGISEATVLHYADYRRSRSWGDVTVALKRAHKEAKSDVEAEAKNLAIYLEDILKPRESKT